MEGCEEPHLPCAHTHTERDEREGCCICLSCGAVLPILSSQNVEWRYGIDDSRVRADVYEHDSDEDDPASFIPGSGMMAKLHMGLSTSNRSRVYREGKDFITSVGVSLSLHQGVIDEAIFLLKLLKDYHTAWRGSRRVGLMISCISLACQKHNIGISDGEILQCPLVRQPTRVMNRQKKLVLQALHEKNITISVQPDASEFSFRICSLLGYDRQFSCRISRTTSKIQNYTHMQSKPCSMIVATSILLLSEKKGMGVDIKLLCSVCGVTRPTLCKWYSECTQRDVADCRSIVSDMDVV
jgi:transcription initiation factor TFIIIB Brf1 subunit/transcription initiation factor TFIIB